MKTLEFSGGVKRHTIKIGWFTVNLITGVKSKLEIKI